MLLRDMLRKGYCQRYENSGFLFMHIRRWQADFWPRGVLLSKAGDLSQGRYTETSTTSQSSSQVLRLGQQLRIRKKTVLAPLN